MIIGFLLAGLCSGCGWGYAAKPYENARPDDNVRYVEAAPSPSAVVAKVVVEDPCAVESFTVFLIEEGSRTTKDVQCRTGQVLSQSRKDIDRGEYRAFQAMNVPMNEWYLLVDPNPGAQRHRQVITNAQLLRLTKRYALRYHHRMPDSGFMIYTYEGMNSASAN